MLPVALKGRSDTLDGVRYWWLADDAMISMRYGRNLAEGLGLVWNAGERVEGYTNLLWTLFMALVHLTPLPDSKTSLVVLLANVVIAAATVPLIGWLVRLLGGGAWATGATLAAYVLGADTSFFRDQRDGDLAIGFPGRFVRVPGARGVAIGNTPGFYVSRHWCPRSGSRRCGDSIGARLRRFPGTEPR